MNSGVALKFTIDIVTANFLHLGYTVYSKIYKEIDADPVFHDLVKRRRKFAILLSTVMLVIYFGFILTIAFMPELFAKPLRDGMVMTIGIPVGIGVILAAFVLTGLYVKKANHEFDRILNRLKDDVGVPHD